MFKTVISTVFVFIITIASYSQVIVADPAFPSEDDQVIITFNSALGNGGLAGYTDDIYAHTGVITSNSSSGSDWKYVKAGWGEDIPECKLTNIGVDLWQLNIGPSIKDYYGVPTNESILQLAFVFRNSDGSQTGKELDGSDIFYDLHISGLNIDITLPDVSPYIVELNDIIEIEGNSIDSDSTFIYDNGELIYADTGNTFNTSISAATFGKHWIIATAKSSDEEQSDSVYYYVRQEQNSVELPSGIKDGINYIDENTVILSLLAPGKDFIFVLGDFNNWEIENGYEMNKTPDNLRFWIELSNLESGKEYIFQYFIDGSIRVGEPYADKVSDPWHDSYINNTTYPNLIEYPSGKTTGIAAVLQTNQEAYNWEIENFNVPPTDELVIYELLVRDFIGKHDFNTLIDTLSYLQRLGINAIELMPNNEFEGNSSWGYNPNYYFAPDKYYGPKDTFKAFVDACHARGIAVFMDLVLNHSYGTNPMVMMYWNSEMSRPAANNPWYNEQSNFVNTDAHWGNDLNHESIYTQQLVDSINSYWIKEYKIDGFRFDFTKGFSNNIKGSNDEWGSNYDSDRIAILKRMADKIWEHKSDAAVIFEHLSVNSEEKELANYGILMWGNINGNYNEATMGYHNNGKSDFSWISYKKRGWNNPHVVGYMESHDEERLMFKNLEFGSFDGNYSIKDLGTALKRQELAANFFFTIPGPKMIWQFGERGYDVSIEFNGRVGEKPPKWDYMDSWQRKNLYLVYKSLIELKKTHQVFNTTNYTLDVSGAMKKIRLTDNDMSVVVLGNFDVKSGNINPQFQFEGMWYEYWTGDSIDVTNVSQVINLQPGEYRLYTSKKLTKPLYVSTNEIYKNIDNINLYPVPTDGTLNVSSFETIDRIAIYNLLGTVVYSAENINNLNISIKTDSFNSGYYFAKVKTKNGKTYTNKFIVR